MFYVYRPLYMQQPEREKYKVVIVGGGAAGIGVARELTHHGINSVLILEGKEKQPIATSLMQ